MLYVFVEGFDDEFFFTKWFSTVDRIVCVQYSQMKADKVNSYLRSIKQMPYADYLFFGDADGKAIEKKKCLLIENFHELEINKVVIVQYEIESWYYAGVSETDCQKLKISKFEFCTDGITKEMLNSKMKNPANRQFVLAKMLDCFSPSLAEDRNTSYRLFSNYIKKPVAAV